MPKAKRGIATKESNSKKEKTSKRNTELEEVLIDNFVSLQKVMTNLSLKFDNLAEQISKLLDLFEISAKALADKNTFPEKDEKEGKKMIEKMDNVLEQNKVIARGLSMLHEKEPRQQMQPPQFRQRPSQMPPQQRREI